MTDRDVVRRKLTSIREQVERMRRRRAADAEEFLADVDRQDALSMSLLVAIQDTLDTALHFASDEGWGVPSSFAEGFRMLEAHGVIDDELARQLSRMAALRDRLAHGYASADMQRIWTELPAGLDALDRFVAAVARHLEQP